jgi:DNA-binding NarL/FixJ family response regulator
MKQQGGQKLMTAVRQVLTGQIYVSEKMSARILEIFSGNRSGKSQSPTANLTDREFEVFELIGHGKGTQEIAKELHLSVKTVEVHRANIKGKLKIKSAPELIREVVRWVESQSSGTI